MVIITALFLSAWLMAGGIYSQVTKFNNPAVTMPPPRGAGFTYHVSWGYSLIGTSASFILMSILVVWDYKRLFSNCDSCC